MLYLFLLFCWLVVWWLHPDLVSFLWNLRRRKEDVHLIKIPDDMNLHTISISPVWIYLLQFSLVLRLITKLLRIVAEFYIWNVLLFLFAFFYVLNFLIVYYVLNLIYRELNFFSFFIFFFCWSDRQIPALNSFSLCII